MCRLRSIFEPQLFSGEINKDDIVISFVSLLNCCLVPQKVASNDSFETQSNLDKAVEKFMTHLQTILSVEVHWPRSSQSSYQ